MAAGMTLNRWQGTRTTAKSGWRYAIQDAHEFLQRAISEHPEMKFCIEIEGAAVGGIGLHAGQDVHRYTATVGYWLGEEFGNAAS